MAMALSFVFPTAAITLLLLILSPSANSVLDTDGHQLTNYGTYYIIPANGTNANPLTYTSVPWPITFHIVQSPSAYNIQPFPVRIMLASLVKLPYIEDSTPVIIEFLDKNPQSFCKHLFWFLKSITTVTQANFQLASVCGVNGEPVNSLVIERARGLNRRAYTLSFCNNNMDWTCKDRQKLGMVDLGVTDLFLGVNPSNPLPVVFQKAKVTSAASM